MLLSVLLLAARCSTWWRGSQRCLRRFMPTPIPSPVAAGMSGGSLSEPRGSMMFLQSLTRRAIANRNEPRATGAGSAAVQRHLVHPTTRGCCEDGAQSHKLLLLHSTESPLNISGFFYSFACMNKIEQSTGIKINAVMTAPRLAQSCNNSRSRASWKEKKRKENPHYTCSCILPRCLTCRSLSLLLAKCTCAYACHPPVGSKIKGRKHKSACVVCLRRM